MLIVDNRAINALKHHEGVRYKPYRDVAGLWTIGVGHLMYPEQVRLKTTKERNAYPLNPKDNRTFTKEEVDGILRDDLHRFEAGVARLCPGVLTQGQFNALVSFSFNLGLGVLQRSTLRQKVNRQDWQGCKAEFLKYIKAGGKVYKGLVSRRNDEIVMFES